MLEKYKEYLQNNMEDTYAVSLQLKKEVSLMVNSFGFDAKKTAESLFEEKAVCESFAKTASYWVIALNYMAGEEYLYDPRNQYAVKIGQALFSMCPMQDLFHKLEIDTDSVRNAIVGRRYRIMDKECCFVTQMMDIHRTLQQTFSKMVFYFLDQLLPDLKNQMNGNWQRCPMI